MKSFHLAKWYLDCVADDGSAVIGYWARLRLSSLHVHYAAVLRSARGEPFRQSSSIRASQDPQLHDGVCTWHCTPLHLHGTWNSRASSFRQTLLRSADGAIRWSCAQPGAQARISIGSGTRHGDCFEIAGYGYVEKIELTVAPWRLPFDLLYWGRFVSREHALVWLEWRATRGDHAPSRRRLAILDGERIARPMVCSDEVRLEDRGKLQLLEPTTVRQGRLGATVTQAVPGLNRLLPASFRRAYEHKQLSRAVLRLPGHEPSCGWAIHELVQW